MTRVEALYLEFEDPEVKELMCASCDVMPADVRLDSGVALCTPCCHESRLLRGEEFRARYIGTVELHSLNFVELELELPVEEAEQERAA
jgi:hypothetical protein